jgi:signal peptidase I
MNFLSSISEKIVQAYTSLHTTLGDGLFILLIFFLFIAIVAQWRLYERADQPGIASIVPIWNAIVFLRIVGRPASHVWYFLIPIWGQLYFIPKVYIELCNSFGKNSILDYVLIIVFNGFYILNLGLSYETVYLGPVYGKQKNVSTQMV